MPLTPRVAREHLMTDLDMLRIRIDDGIGSRMPDHVERLGWAADRLAEYQRLRLRRPFTHAVRHSSFHFPVGRPLRSRPWLADPEALR